jgi:hypothetical protein
MSEGKIEFQIGDISFVGEGQQEWLSKQLDKVIENFGEKKEISTSENSSAKESKPTNSSNDTSNAENAGNSIYDVNLSIFLRNQEATSNQRLKFLATAAWLAKREENHLKTIDVTKALRESKQTSLTNASDCLNQNVSQGFCEKEGDHFYVTPHGFVAIEGSEE